MKLMTYLGIALTFSLPAKAVYIDGGIECGSGAVAADTITQLDFWEVWGGWIASLSAVGIGGPSVSASAWGYAFELEPAVAATSISPAPVGTYQFFGYHFVYSELWNWWPVAQVTMSCEVQSTGGGGGGGGVNHPTPMITSVSPDVWPAGESLLVNIHGTGFVTDPELIINGTGVSAYMNYGSDTHISAQVNISPNAPSGYASIQVTSHGYNGMAFQQPQGGGGPTSPTATAQVQGLQRGATISSNQYVSDGGQATFSVTPFGDAPSSFAWSFSAPAGGDNPNVVFSNPAGSMTSTNAHWYANPNDSCTASRQAAYTIQATVAFPGGFTASPTAALFVDVPWNIGGETDFDIPQIRIVGGVTTAQDGNGDWRITGQGNLNVVAPIKMDIYVSPASQFYGKVLTHEQKHASDLTAGYLRTGDFYAQIANFKDATQLGLFTQIGIAGGTFINSELSRSSADRATLERNAYAVSDSIPPQYMYQNCGRF